MIRGERQRPLNKCAASDRGVHCQKLWLHQKFCLPFFFFFPPPHSTTVFGNILRYTAQRAWCKYVDAMHIPCPIYIYLYVGTQDQEDARLILWLRSWVN